MPDAASVTHMLSSRLLEVQGEVLIVRYPCLTSPSWRVRDFGVWRGRAGVCSQARGPHGEGREPGGGPRSETVAPALRGRGLFVANEEKTVVEYFCPAAA